MFALGRHTKWRGATRRVKAFETGIYVAEPNRECASSGLFFRKAQAVNTRMTSDKYRKAYDAFETKTPCL